VRAAVFSGLSGEEFDRRQSGEQRDGDAPMRIVITA
jgi:hypothetical protein